MSTQNPYQAPTGDLETSNNENFGEIRFFSPSTRIGRLRYLAHGMLFMLAVYAVVAIFAIVIPSVGLGTVTSGLMIAILVPLYIFILYISILFMVQRLHDMNRSGWLWLLTFIPLVNLIFVLWILFAPGTPGANDYGLRPPPNKVWHWFAGLALPIVFVVGILAAIAIPAYQQYVERAQAAQSSYN